MRSMSNLLGEIEKIKPTYPDKRWEFWFSVPRGTLKQYIKFNKYYDAEDCSEEKFQKDMEEEFPRKKVIIVLLLFYGIKANMTLLKMQTGMLS